MHIKNCDSVFDIESALWCVAVIKKYEEFEYALFQCAFIETKTYAFGLRIVN